MYRKYDSYLSLPVTLMLPLKVTTDHFEFTMGRLPIEMEMIRSNLMLTHFILQFFGILNSKTNLEQKTMHNFPGNDWREMVYN